MAFQYPSIVSRTLDPSGRGLVHVTGIHDKRLSDADVNLIGDLEAYNRKQLTFENVCSGALTLSPFAFTPSTPLSLSIPAFAALVKGELVSVGGNNSAGLTNNIVTVPAPGFYTPGSTTPQNQIYIVFLEAWYQRLDPVGGTGFAQAGGLFYFYPLGCVNGLQANWLPNDTIDPIMGLETTERVQFAWALRVQPVANSYDFTTYNFGLDPGAISTEIVYGQGNQAQPSSTSPYQFTNMASINGDTGLWRAGDGNVSNELASMDGYSYAIPVAVIFQRNSGIFQVDQNPFGCGNPATGSSGLIASADSGRFDSYYADAIYPTDVVDTRSMISMEGWDVDELMRQGFTDVVTGTMQQKIARGVVPGSQVTALGSQLAYNVAVTATEILNTDTIGAFDGYMNGFSSASGIYYSTQAITVNQKVVGSIGSNWQQNDAFMITLSTGSQATIANISVQGLVSNPVASTLMPVLLLQGQLTIAGTGTNTVTVTIAKNLTGTSYDPGLNPLYVTIGVQYPAGTGMDLGYCPSKVYGGTLLDGASGQTMPVYGVDEYAVQTALSVTTATSAVAINPEYSNVIFGVRVTVPVLASTGVATTNASGATITTFTLTPTNLNGPLNGIYVISAADSSSGTLYNITVYGRAISSTGSFILQLSGAVVANSTVLVTYLIANTATLAYNAPIQGVTSIEETVFGGNMLSSGYRMDSRIQVISTQYVSASTNTVVLAVTDCLLSGIAGDDVNKLIWVLDAQGNIDAVQISSAVFSDGFVTLVVPATVNLTTSQFFVVAAIRPAFPASSIMVLTEYYVPYQGEGKLTRDYEIMHTEDFALVTTNGTGAAPVPGLADVYPYNRELPLTTRIPSQVLWPDSGLANTPVQSMFDSNFVAKRYGNVEHTFEVPVHTNDFIEPVNDDKRKSFQFTIAGEGRGFSKAQPHLGFAITPVIPRTASSNVTSNSAPVVLYVNNATGSDNNDGLSLTTAFLTITAALNVLPPVLRFPCSIQLVYTGVPFQISALQTTLQTVRLGDGQIRSTVYYALGNIGFTIQESGQLIITAAGGSPMVTIDCTGFAGFGDGPTSAFFIDNTRVLFNQIQFKGFTNPALYASNADVELVNCVFIDNVQAGSFIQGCTVILDGGTVDLGSNGTGFVLSSSDMVVSAPQLTVDASTTPGAFFVAGYGSSISLQTHSLLQETNIGASTLIASALLNSSIICASDFSSQGAASLVGNSVISRTVAVSPFAGGVTLDPSSTTTTSL